MVQDWEKTLYDSARPNCSNVFLMPKRRLEDDLIAAYHDLHGEKILPCLHLAGKSGVRAHCWKLEPAEMRYKTLAQMVVHWNSRFPEDVLRKNRSPRVFKARVLCLAGARSQGSGQTHTGHTWWPGAEEFINY